MNPSQQSYEILGLKEGASLAEIRQAFKELAFQYHPDRNPHNPHAEEQFKKVAQAYAALSGNQEMFVALERPHAGAKEARRFVGDIFGDIFDLDAQRWNARGKDVKQVLSLEWKEASKGCSKTLLVIRESYCPSCLGSGGKEGSSIHLCSYCFGQGLIEPQGANPPSPKPCPKCLGTGRVPAQACEACRGRGVRTVSEKRKVRLPPGLATGQELRVSGFGSQIRKEEEPGDLVLQIRAAPAPTFTFDGAGNLCEILSKFLKKIRHFFLGS